MKKRNTEKIITAKDFIKVYLELIDLIPDTNVWSENNFENNPSCLYRLKQLNAILVAFRIKSNWIDFSNGEFVFFRPINQYLSIQNTINEYKYSKEFRSLKQEKITHQDIMRIFKFFIDFIIKEYSLESKINRYILANRLPLQYFIQKIKSYRSPHNIKITNSIIDDLAKIINPSGKGVKLKTLIDKYNYPDVDLKEIDIENW